MPESRPRRPRIVMLAGAGVALAAGALWLRLGWAPGHVGTAAEVAAQYAHLGGQAALSGRFTQAAAFYERAVALDPRNVDAWIGLASARADADDRAGSLRALERAQEVASGSPDVDRAIARVRLRFGQFAEARAAAERALRQTPDDAYTVVLSSLARAEALSSASDEADVSRLAQYALQLGYKGPEPYYALGLVALHRRRVVDAVEAFRAAVTRDPRSPTMRYRLAAAYRLAGRTREADRELASFRRLARSPVPGPAPSPAAPAP